MVTIKLEIKTDKTGTFIYASRLTGGTLTGQNPPRPQNENWLADPWWTITEYFATNVIANVWKSAYFGGVNNLKNGDRIPLAFDDNGVVGHTSVQMRLSINGKIVKTVTHDNMLHDYSEYRVTWSALEEPSPTYLETLDKLDQWSSAHYIPNSREQLNL